MRRGLNRETGANEASFVGHRTKKLLEVRATPSSVPARKSWPLYRSGATPVRFAIEAFTDAENEFEVRLIAAGGRWI